MTLLRLVRALSKRTLTDVTAVGVDDSSYAAATFWLIGNSIYLIVT